MLDAQDLVKSYPSAGRRLEVLRGVSLQVAARESVALTGESGSGKSTLLQALTQSEVFIEDKLFATLDPVSRRLRFPRDREVIITDTVGFIRDLPPALVTAFRATLEELADASLRDGMLRVEFATPASRRSSSSSADTN